MENKSGYTGDLPSDEELAEYSAAWDLEMQIDDVEEEIASNLKFTPATVTENEINKANLERLRNKLASLRQGSNQAKTTPAPVVVSQPKQRAQESRILQLLTSAGYDPLRLPKREQGKAGTKAEIRALALRERSLFTDISFGKAWERLRRDCSITETP